MSRKVFFVLLFLFLMISCNVAEVDFYKELSSIANSIRQGFGGYEGDDFFFFKVNREMTIEENIREVSIQFQNEMHNNTKNLGIILPDELLFENQGDEITIYNFVDFLGAVKFPKFENNIDRGGTQIFPTFCYKTNTSCILATETCYTEYFCREMMLVTVFAQKDDGLIMYRKMFVGRNPLYFTLGKELEAREEKLKKLLSDCFPPEKGTSSAREVEVPDIIL